jgi:hypothetical protein
MNSQYSIVIWARAFDKLYEKPDSKRSPEEIWIATMAHCSSIGEAIRKSDYVELMECAVRTFCWLLSYSVHCAKTEDLLFHCKNNFCEMVYLKFPGVCGHCSHIPCDCKPVEMDAGKDKAGKYEKLLEKWKRDESAAANYTIKNWLESFEEIYSGRIHLQTMETLGFHFLEEAGEEAMAVRKLMQLRGVLSAGVDGIDKGTLSKLVSVPSIAEEYIRLGKGQLNGKPPFNLASGNYIDIYNRIVDAKMDFIVELADLFSFFCSILIKLGRMTIGKGKTFVANLEETLVDTYGNPDEGLTCPVCKKKACECTFYSKLAI